MINLLKKIKRRIYVKTTQKVGYKLSWLIIILCKLIEVNIVTQTVDIQ